MIIDFDYTIDLLSREIFENEYSIDITFFLSHNNDNAPKGYRNNSQEILSRKKKRNDFYYI